MPKERSMISFDWAIKRLLRQKANFEVLEGFLSELLRRDIAIKNIGESEGNKSAPDDKTNRVDMLVEADNRELVIIELQFQNELDYYLRMLYGVSKAVTDYMHTGDSYSNVRKVYSIHIVYYDLGGDDYIYHGVNHFTGVNTNTELRLNAVQQELYQKVVAADLFPEYYIISLKGFNDVAKNTVDEWVYYLKNNRIEKNFTARGLDKARKILWYDKLSEADKKAYDRAVDGKLSMESAFFTTRLEGRLEGKAEEKRETARNLKALGVAVETIAEATGLSIAEINGLG